MESLTYKHVIVASKMGDRWFNSDEARFAIIPDSDEVNNTRFADTVEAMVEQAAHGNLFIREEALRELLDMHSQQLVLFPLGFLWGRSGFGKVHEQWFVHVLSDVDPDIVDQRGLMEDLPAMIAVRSPVRRSNLAFVMWKMLVAFLYSSFDVNNLEDFQPFHISALASMMRPEGEWANWTTIWTHRSIRFCVHVLAMSRNDPNFGREIDEKGYQTRGSRKVHTWNRPHLKWFDTSFDRWVDELHLLQTKTYLRTKTLIGEALGRLPSDETNNAIIALSRSTVLHVIKEAETWSTPSLRISAVGIFYEYGKWMQEESRGSDGNPTLAFALAKTDVERFKKKFSPLISRSNGTEVAARPMPQKYHRELVRIISDDDFAWPKSQMSDKNGRPRHWIMWENPETGEAIPVFCEVLPRLLLLMLDLPLRGIQARRLDSGEGDSRRWNEDTGRWEESSSKHAGYWKAAGVRNQQRGVFREMGSLGADDQTITGFWINSNKTQDATSLFDETSGYEIPWELTDALQNLAAMRAWQEKYNSVDGPLPFSEIPKGIFQDEPTKSVRSSIPSRFYLFRYPPNGGARGREAPPTYKALLQFFYDALDELERRLNSDDPESPIVIITTRDSSGAPRKSIFTMHGMRSSTITSLLNEGVPIAILSKLVAGHATILMTLSYAKFEPAHVSQILTNARMEALAKSALDFPVFLQNASFEHAARMTATLSDDGLRQMKGQFSEPSFWSRMDFCICPNGGTLCHIGGALRTRRVHNGIDKSIYGPVPGGAKNCVRCRFMVSGYPYLIPAWGHANRISAHVDALHLRIAERERELEALKLRRRELSRRNEPSSSEMRRRIAVLEAEWNADIDARDQAYADLHATLVLIEQIRALNEISTPDDSKIPMIVRESGLPKVEGRISTRFELTDAVVQISRFYPSLESAELERERDNFVDTICYREGYVPLRLTPLSIEERRASADAFAALLLSEIGAEETQTLIEGSKTLADFGLQGCLEDVCRRTIGKPLQSLPLNLSGRSPNTTLELNSSASSPSQIHFHNR